MYKTKSKKGITLVSLVITIIVLMILAGVAISLATGEDSIFSKANEVASKWNESAINEQETVNMLLNVLEGGTIPEQKEKVNPPEIKEGMIPVYYDNGWKKADTSKDNWYNYHESKKEWANVVTVKENGSKTRSYYQSAEEGEPIAEEDILAMFVWIPRYAYNIASGYHTAANGTGDIQIKFLEGVEDNYEGGTAVRQEDTNAITNGDKYVVHPAFTEENIGEEITGMWVGKFESSNASSPYNNEGITESSNENLKKGLGDGTTQDVTIRPNVTSWRWTEVPTMYEVSQKMNDAGNIHGLTSQTDTMMMKNSQWGAVAYLAQSKYGNKQGTDGESGIWNNPYNEGYIYENASNSAGYGISCLILL